MKVSIKQYAQALFDLTAGKSEREVLTVVKKFAEKLKSEGQLKNVGKITDKFQELYNRKHGIVRAEVTTRYKMQDAGYAELKNYIKTRYGAGSVELAESTKEEIKGGVIIRVGDEVIDGSVRKQLTNLRKVLYS